MPAMSGFVDHYRVLGVSSTATADEIRQAYRRAVHRDHADRNPDDGAASERMRAIVTARDVLCDPWRRARFDLARAVQARQVLAGDSLVDLAARAWGQAPPPTRTPTSPPRTGGWVGAAVVGAAGLAAALGLSLVAAANIARSLRARQS